jgi:uncharacterized protein YceK
MKLNEVVLLLALTITVAGCSSIQGRSKNTGVYPGMRAWPKVSNQAIVGCGEKLNPACWGFGPVAFPFIVMDFAITLPVDTVWFPVDAFYVTLHPPKSAKPPVVLEPPRPDLSREPYDGTGVVTRVMMPIKAQDQAKVDFRPNPPPPLRTFFELVVTKSRAPARLRVVENLNDGTSRAMIDVGTIKAGDTVITRPGRIGYPNYQGTGVVVEVISQPPDWKQAEVDFASHSPPRPGMHLLLIRGDTVVGRVRVDPRPGVIDAFIGSPQIGDVVIGICSRLKK